MFRHFRDLYSGTIIANVDFDRARGDRLIDPGLADMAAFGRTFIANPDLPTRIALDAPLADVNWPTVYGSTSEGYNDYPTLQPAAA